MTSFADAREFLVELISQLFHADVLITEQAERIDALEAENDRLRGALADKSREPAGDGTGRRPGHGIRVRNKTSTDPRGRA